MSLNTFAFALFFPVVFAVYQLMPLRRRWLVIAGTSGAFIALAQPAAIATLSLAVLVAYVTGLALERARSRASRRAVLGAGVLLLLVPWFVTRYVSHAPIAALGVAFYTLRLVSYVIDVHAGRIPVERHAGMLAAYAAFFPEFLAGPIDRSAALIPQIAMPGPFDVARAFKGLKRFAWGLVQKSVVADQLGLFVDPVFADPASWGGVSLALATVFYAFQILYDFAGYSDMAIGAGEVLGFRLMANFDHPYRSQSVSEFWRRWHISLSSWLRDYVFLPFAYPLSRGLDRPWIPLGPGAREQVVYAIATLATMFLAGIWHGSGWHFLMWGSIIGISMVLSRATKRARARFIRGTGLMGAPRLLGAVRTALVFALISLAWVFFRARSVADAIYIVGHLGDGAVEMMRLWVSTAAAPVSSGAGRLAPLLVGNQLPDLAIACAGIVGVELIRLLQRRRDLYLQFMTLPDGLRWAAYYAVTLVILALGHFDRSVFIYAQF